MARHGNRRPGVAPRLGGNYGGSSNGANVVIFKPTRNSGRLVSTDPASVPQSPAFATFLGTHPEAIAPLAMLGRRLDRREITLDHATAALAVIVELFQQGAP
jgi:hypothetical protein